MTICWLVEIVTFGGAELVAGWVYKDRWVGNGEISFADDFGIIIMGGVKIIF